MRRIYARICVVLPFITNFRILNSMKTVGIIANRKLLKNPAILKDLLAYLDEKGKKIVVDEHLKEIDNTCEFMHREKIFEIADMVITLGGDGTVLKAARTLEEGREVPILAVNLGTLGFLTEVSPRKIMKALDAIFEEKKFYLDHRSILRVTVYRQSEKIFTTLALNDAVINQGNFARLIALDTEIEKQGVTKIRADGLIISTPTGSTGHSLSANGPIVHPLVEALILTPICPVGLHYRPIVIPNDRQIKVIVDTERREYDQASDVGLTIDGQIVFPLKYGDEIKIRKSSQSFALIRLKKYNYYKVLRQKLGWGA